MSAYYEDHDYDIREEPLLARQVRSTPSPSPPPYIPREATLGAQHKSSDTSSRHKRPHRPAAQATQGDAVLIHYLGPNNPDVALKAATIPLIDSDSDSEADVLPEEDVVMADGGEGSDPPNEPDPEPTLVQDPKRLADTIAVAQAAQQIFDSQDRDEKEPVVDVKEEVESEQNLPVRLGEPCRVSTSSQARRSSQIDGHHANEHFPREEAINGADKDGIIGRSGTSSTVTKADSSEHPAMSPRLLGHTIDGEPEQKLPAMQTSHPEGPSSPAAERLPGFKIMKDIAETTEKEQLEAARLNNIRQRRGHSFSSIAGSPPQLNNHYSSNGSHRSPSSQFPPLNTSSFGTHSSPHLGAHSPLSGSNPYYAARRQSQASDAYPPALTSASTTESYSSIDSTSPLGPTEHHISIDGNAIILPPPSGSLAGISLIPPHGPPSGFPCDYPGCTAPPFQTQYLLNSHANVHSQNRPHYCPMRGCPRSEGGKGFKRKNEMIRHGLVHDSPGYICPFCPDREHRHVRVHHIDKDKDDAALRDVLSQRPEGGSRGRRRRG